MHLIIYIITIILLLFDQIHGLSIEIQKNSMVADKAPMKLLLGNINSDIERDCELWQIATGLQKALERSGQFSVAIQDFQEIKKKKDITDLFVLGHSLVILLNHSGDKKAIEWRIYDATEGLMVQGKRLQKRGPLTRGYAYNIADELWPILTKQPSSFSTKLAYTKLKNKTLGRQQSVVCVSDFDGSFEEEIISVPGTYVGLYWHNNNNNPYLLCSEFTRFNVRLISVSMNHKKRVLLNFVGTCVGVSLSSDENQAVYCRSGNIWHYAYDQNLKKGSHVCLIKNDGKNTSPTILDNGDIIFCSDSKEIRKGQNVAKGPQVCYYHADNKTIELITKEGYCTGPTYCISSNTIAYSKKINGKMQIFSYSINTKKHKQLTFDDGNKIDCCWSPCGNYILFCYQKDKISRIAVFNLPLNKMFFITDAKSYCTSPSWSPIYNTFPTLMNSMVN